jgi:hydrogenase nickel incorporation protein HypA/HybF
MHEAQIARRLLAVVLERAAAAGARRVLAVRATLAEPGRLSRDSVVQHFALEAAGTMAAGARLDLEATPIEARCEGCKTTYLPDHGVCLCPRCGSGDGRLLGRPGLGIETLEIEAGENR